jgi:hypothetical protein
MLLVISLSSVMAALDAAIQEPQTRRVLTWMAGHVLGLDPWIEPGHDKKR